MRDPLLLILPGLNMEPAQLEHIAYIGAYSGLRTLLIPWDTQSPVGYRCVEEVAGVQIVGGECATACSTAMRQELIDGHDDPGTPVDYEYTLHAPDGDIPNTPGGYEGRYLSSIRHRVGRALNALYEADDMDNNVDDWQWDGYCSPDDTYGTKITWSEVVIGGFSMGGTMAQYIGFTETTAGVFAAEGYGDYCDVTDGTSYTPAVASWLGGTNATTTSKWRAPMNSNSHQLSSLYLPKSAGWPLAFTNLGLTVQPDDYDNYSGSTPYSWTGNTMQTNQGAANNRGEHASMGEDFAMPNTVSGGINTDEAPGSGTKNLYLFDAYLDAMCSY